MTTVNRMPGDLLERERELDRATAALDQALDGQGTAVAFLGPPGIGKTSLLGALADGAGTAGTAVLAARGSEFERGFPFALARQLLAPAVASIASDGREDLLAGAAGLGAAAIDLEATGAPTAGRDEALFAAVHGLYWLASNLAERRPLLLAIDDAQWADPESLRWIAYLCRRLEELPILVALAAREEEPATDWSLLDALIRDAGVQAIRPAPLSEAAVATLLAERLGSIPEPEFVEACMATAGGNPFLLSELLASLAADGVSPLGVEAWRLRDLGPETVARAALERVGRLGPECARLAKGLAILGDGSELSLAAALTGLEPDAAEAAADALARAGVLRRELPLSFIHPLVRAAIHEDIGPAERARGHARAARLLADRGAAVDRVAGELLESERLGEQWAVEQLREAARSALARGAPELAARYLGRALAELPPAADRAVVLTELGSAEVGAGQVRDALGHLGEAIELSRDPEERLSAQRGHALALLTLGRPDDAIDVLIAAIAERPDADPTLRLGLEAELASLREMSMSAERRMSTERLEGVVASLDGDGAAQRVLLACLSHARMRQCRPAGEVAKLAERALGPGGEALQQGPGIIGRAQGMVALICAEELDRAEAIAAADLTAARARGAMFELGLNTLFLAVAALFRGAIRDSEAGARLVLELVGEHGFPAEVATAGAVLVESLTEQGERDAAWAELEALGMAGELPELNTFSWVLAARGSLRAAGGEYEAALEDLAEAGRRLASWGVSNPAEGRWRSAAALAQLRLGRRDRAVALADEELELARAFGTPRAVGIALRARGLAEGGDRGIELLAEAAEILAGSVARLEQARAMIDLGAALRRANRRSEARSSLKKGLALARRCGAVPLAEFAHIELEASGARQRKIVRSGVDALTPSERRVARMAAAGATNKEIAQALFITTRTVETHLRHCYQKLEISSRTGLPAALGDPEVAPE